MFSIRNASVPRFPFVLAMGVVVHLTDGDALAQSCTPQALPTTLPSPGLPPSAEFGAAAAVSFQWALVGAPGADSGKGLVYAYHLVDGTWNHIQTIAAPDAGVGDRFGAAIAMRASTLIIGAPLADANGADSGATYTYLLSQFGGGSFFAFNEKQIPNGVEAGDQYGAAIAADLDDFVVGAPNSDEAWVDQGAAYYMADTGPTWGKGFTATKLLAPLPQFGERFGAAVALHEDVLAVGAPGYDKTVPLTSNVGRVIVYKRQGLPDNYTWPFQAQLNPTTTQADRGFGSALDARFGNLLIGAPGDAPNAGIVTGAAHLYRYDVGLSAWFATLVMTSPSAQVGSAVGTDVAFGHDWGSSAVRFAWICGKERVDQYEFSGGWWIHEGELVPPFADLGNGPAEKIGSRIAAFTAPDFLILKPGDANGESGKVYPFHSCGGTISVLGTGTLGLGGIPELRGAGSLAADLPFELKIKNGKPNAPALILVNGGLPVGLNFHGGVLFTYPIQLALPFTLSAAGELNLPTIMPAGYSGVNLTLQSVIADPLAKGGASITNGLYLKLAP